MFTGIIREVGSVEAVQGGEDGVRLVIAASLAGELSEGDSVAVEGVCLTATSAGDSRFTADAMNQTLRLTTLGALRPESEVNLEPPLRVGEPLGGHIVQGHVDGIGEVAHVAPDGFARSLEVTLPAALRPYVVEHGSITLAGASLTVAQLTDTGVEVSLIPETLERTTLGRVEAGSALNVEVDVIARYVERLLRFQEKHHE